MCVSLSVVVTHFSAHENSFDNGIRCIVCSNNVAQDYIVFYAEITGGCVEIVSQPVCQYNETYCLIDKQ